MRASQVLSAIVLAGVTTGTVLAQTQAPAPPQTPASREAQLLQRTAQFPDDIVALLDLTRIYVDQRRFDDASKALQRAQAAIQRESLVTGFMPPPSSQVRAGEAVYRVSGQIREPRRTKFVEPIKPQIAQVAQVSGYVIIEAIVGVDGRIRDAKVIKSQPLLDQAALDAVLQWEYEPALLNGVAVPVIFSVTVIMK
jgi:TonB family protein